MTNNVALVATFGVDGTWITVKTATLEVYPTVGRQAISNLAVLLQIRLTETA